ncbi:DUF2142 domain-containing protein [Pantoea anthophila]|uniref:DUF2142 domain-containing protein n=1 Tax=Pantoea anthophila TaxID=470931 RepID=UPI002DBF9A6F|nr:DUF2142 domain-containing protein [Pantoea anthophila]MEB5707356.1 DUF2142 domain-containing protein [Pantoea anthophila]MEB6518227.1 DUF2142 domain-containing protein [Pantoea anthophila]
MSSDLYEDSNGSGQAASGKVINIKYLYLLVAVILMAGYLIVVSVKPPFSSPDEPNHLARSDALWNGDFVLSPVKPTGNSGGMVGSVFHESVSSFSKMLHSHDPEQTKSYLETLKTIQWDGKKIPYAMANVAFYFPVVYLPQAISFKVGELLGLSFYDTYILLNAITFLSVLVILWMAMRIYPIPATAILLLILPTALFQIMSPTIDGLSMALAVLAMSIFMRLLSGENEGYSRLLWLMGFVIISVSGSRANLLPMILIPAWLYFKNKRKENIACFVVVAAIALAWTAFNLVNVQDTFTARHPGHTNSELVSYYIKHPIETFRIIWGTISDPAYFNFYTSTMVGVIAWLDAPVLMGIVDIFNAAICLYFLSHLYLSRGVTGNSNRLFILAISSISAILIFCAILAQWSPFPTERVIGVQGRYFLIPLIMIAYAIPSKPEAYKYTILPLIFFFGLSVIGINFALSARFFM